MNMLISYKAIPYNAEGIAIHRAVNLSKTQKSQINYEAGFDSARQIETVGYCLLINKASAQVRGSA
ncbi:DUF3383 domain-containing protein [Snodgrassella sp. ESL0323]|uniref:hypothetical protein n=1 Tax=Snodgrassella sp. ESL0323 TaxID=2705034 RepID=UPI001582A1D6|nr:hypothetical protein [Snodgrassella sp. ESL0323]NUF78371.1 DUF3383 domain-containing protein [Snodgrassella sp. ESL0323]